MYSKEEQKKAAAWQAAMEVEDNMVLGLGTGSTVYYLMEKLSERIRGGLNVHGAATSLETEGLARCLGIPLISLEDARTIHLAIDGWTLLTRISIPLRAEAVPCSVKRSSPARPGGSYGLWTRASLYIP